MDIHRLLIDIGHGPSNRTTGVYDPGAASGGLTEHGIVKAVALAAKLLLDPFPVVVCPDDRTLSRTIQWINRNKLPKDCLFALHMNAGSGTGVEVYYCPDAPPARKAQADLLAKTIATTLGIRNRGGKPDTASARGRIAMVRDARLPSFLIEIAFIDNPADVKAAREHGARAIADALQALRSEG